MKGRKPSSRLGKPHGSGLTRGLRLRCRRANRFSSFGIKQKKNIYTKDVLVVLKMDWYNK